MPLLKRVRVLGAAIEATPGTAATITASNAAHNVYDVEIQADTTVSERKQQGGFNYLLSTVEGHSGTVTFKMNPYGNGAGSGGAWEDVFMPACGLVNGSPVAEAPGSNVKTITIAVYENGIIKTLVGCAGDFTMTMATGKLVELEFTFTGVWKDPSDGAILAPTYPTEIPYRATGTMTLGSWTPCVESAVFNMGNNVILRECQDDVSGFKAACITDRKPTCTINPEATLVADNDAYQDFLDSVEKTFDYTITQGSDSMTLDVNSAQIMSISEGDRNGIQIDDIELCVLEDDFTLNF